jgi:hypothetical protein
MTTQKFELQPFPGQGPIPDIQIIGEVRRSSRHQPPQDQLTVTYHLQGTIADIYLPPPIPAPVRQSELWESTCLELFIGLTAQSRYWEVNLAPNGNWNVFALSDYRQGMCEARQIDQLKIITQQNHDRFTLETSMPLTGIAVSDTAIVIAVTAVIQTKAGDISFWAIHHCSNEPDFHRRDSFTLSL